jgi:hypothetical protein
LGGRERSGLKESRDSEVVLHDTDYVPFMACLEFIYSGQVKIPDPDFAIELVLKPHDTHDTHDTHGC